MIYEDLIFLKKKFIDKKEFFDFSFKILRERNIVKESYYESIINREKMYPTGLQTKYMGIAVPHTDTMHVNKDAFLFVSLEEPLLFGNMSGDEDKVEVELIFMMVLSSPGGQIKALQNLSNIFIDDEKLKRLRDSNDINEVREILGKVLDDNSL